MIIVTQNLLRIKEISFECLDHKLFVPGQIAEKCFRGKYTIYRIAYLSKIAWAMQHQNINETRASYFTHRLYRRKGIAVILQRALLGDIFDNWYYEDFNVENGTIRHKCTVCKKQFVGCPERIICKKCLNVDAP